MKTKELMEILFQADPSGQRELEDALSRQIRSTGVPTTFDRARLFADVA